MSKASNSNITAIISPHNCLIQKGKIVLSFYIIFVVRKWSINRADEGKIVWNALFGDYCMMCDHRIKAKVIHAEAHTFKHFYIVISVLEDFTDSIVCENLPHGFDDFIKIIVAPDFKSTFSKERDANGTIRSFEIKTDTEGCSIPPSSSASFNIN